MPITAIIVSISQAKQQIGASNRFKAHNADEFSTELASADAVTSHIYGSGHDACLFQLVSSVMHLVPWYTEA